MKQERTKGRKEGKKERNLRKARSFLLPHHEGKCRARDDGAFKYLSQQPLEGERVTRHLAHLGKLLSNHQQRCFRNSINPCNPLLNPTWFARPDKAISTISTSAYLTVRYRGKSQWWMWLYVPKRIKSNKKSRKLLILWRNSRALSVNSPPTSRGYARYRRPSQETLPLWPDQQSFWSASAAGRRNVGSYSAQEWLCAMQDEQAQIKRNWLIEGSIHPRWAEGKYGANNTAGNTEYGRTRIVAVFFFFKKKFTCIFFQNEMRD